MNTTMTKFYVSSGNQSLTLIAPSAASAAMELVDRLLSPHRWIYREPSLRQQDRRDHVILEALLNLDSTIKVSWRGLGRNDAGEFEVPELLDQWHAEMSSFAKVNG